MFFEEACNFRESVSTVLKLIVAKLQTHPSYENENMRETERQESFKNNQKKERCATA